MGGWMGGGWEAVDGGGWNVDARRWMGGGYGEWGEFIRVHHQQTAMTPLH
jgi:hypothetical protein